MAILPRVLCRDEIKLVIVVVAADEAINFHPLAVNKQSRSNTSCTLQYLFQGNSIWNHVVFS